MNINRTISGATADRMSSVTEDRYPLQPRISVARQPTLALRSSISRKPSKTPQLQPNLATSILQRRDHIRIYEDGEDVTPRLLIHSEYPPLEERITAFDVMNPMFSQSSSLGPELPRASISRLSSFSSVLTEDEQKRYSSQYSIGTSPNAVSEVLNDAPSQFPLPRFDTREFTSMEDRIVLTLRETETIFLLELPQETVDANTEERRAVAEENERYQGLMGGLGRKTANAEVQTPQLYTKTRGTFIGRKERKNSSTYVSNWVMHDSYEAEKNFGAGEPPPDRFKFTWVDTVAQIKAKKRDSEPDERLEALAQLEGYEDATRVTLRILAAKNFETAQKRFAGMLRQDPCDPDLELVYQLDLLWKHSKPEILQKRSVSTLQWNPANDSLLAVGYCADPKMLKDLAVKYAQGLLLIWCAKNPSEPDRIYEFSSQISDLDWSKTKPNLLAIGFYDGIIRIIDVSKRNLVVLRETQQKNANSFGPYWQIQWWPIEHESINSTDFREQLIASNQDGKISTFSANEDFVPNEKLRVLRLEGKVPGVKRVNHCLGHSVPISRHAAALLVRRHPNDDSVYLVGTEEGCVLRCSINQSNTYLENFLAHDGPIYALEFSPFHSGLLLTCGADWFVRVWAYGLKDQPLLSFNSGMACVNAAAWSPRNSTIFATAVGNEILIWDLSRKSHRPTSVTQVSSSSVRVLTLGFTRSGEQIVAGDDDGNVYVFGLTGMPLPAFDQKKTLIEAVHKALLTKPKLLHKLQKLDPHFVF